MRASGAIDGVWSCRHRIRLPMPLRLMIASHYIFASAHFEYEIVLFLISFSNLILYFELAQLAATSRASFQSIFPAKMFSRVNLAFSTFGKGSLLNKLLLESAAVSFEQPAVQTIERKGNYSFFLNKLLCAVKLAKIDCFLLEPWFMNIVKDERRINWFWSHQTDFKMLNLISFYHVLSSHQQADDRL